MKYGRRKFVGGLAAAGAVAATVNPISALAGSTFNTSVPAELRKGLADGSTIMRVSLVENVSGRRHPCNDHATLDLVLHGNSETPGAGSELVADRVSWEITRAMIIDGIRIFGGEIGGRPYQNFAWFRVAPKLENGNTLTVGYTLSFHSDIMDEENRDRPFRDLIDKSERQSRGNDRVNMGREIGR